MADRRLAALPRSLGLEVLTAELVLLDGTAMLFRAFHAVPPRAAADGAEVGALHGLAQHLVRLASRARSRHFAAVFDPGTPSFRQGLDPAYKANREAPPAALAIQRDLAPAMTRALGFATFVVGGWEADDLMATLAARGRAEGLPVWLVSPDKDLFQLVTAAPPPVRIWRPWRRETVDAAGVEQRLGVPPAAAADWYALVGDSSDNVAGVRGVGPKAATALLAHFGSLDALYDRLDEVAGLSIRGARTLAARLAQQRDAAELARRLVTLRPDAPVGGDAPLVQALRWRGPRPDAQATLGPLGLGPIVDALRRVPGGDQGASPP